MIVKFCVFNYKETIFVKFQNVGLACVKYEGSDREVFCLVQVSTGHCTGKPELSNRFLTGTGTGTGIGIGIGFGHRVR